MSETPSADIPPELLRDQAPDQAQPRPDDPNLAHHVVITMDEHNEPVGAVIVYGKEAADGLVKAFAGTGAIMRVVPAISI